VSSYFHLRLCGSALFVALGVLPLRSEAAVYNVGSLADLTSQIASAQPGDQILVSNGVYTTASPIYVSCAGTPAAPIVIAAQNVGGAQIAGTSGFYLSGASCVTLQGFYFSYGQTNQQNGLQIDKTSTRCRITRNIFENDPIQYWCFVQGDDTEVDHNLFRNKIQKGEYVTLDGDHSTLQIARRLWLHDNHFYNNQYAGSNGGESTRLGIGIFKLISAWAVVENNLYQQADGDPEAISAKTSDNVIRYNTLTNSIGTISLRQGCRSRIEGNFIFNSGGIKFYADDHLILNNYLQGVTDGLQFGGGDWAEITDSDNNASGPHAAAHRAQVQFNTLVNCPVYFDLNMQSSALGTNNPTDCIVANNILQGNSGYFVSPGLNSGQTNFTWKTNIFWGSASTAYSPTGGYQKVNPQLTNTSAIPYHIASNSPAIGATYGALGEAAYDMDGQPRVGTPDIGADEYSAAPRVRRPLGTNDVGPYVAATNFAIVAMPWIQTVMPGWKTSYTNWISPYNGFTNPVTLSVTNLPSGASAVFSQDSLSNSFGFSVLSVSTTDATPPGRYTLLITAASAAFTNTTVACLTVGNLSSNWRDVDIGAPGIQGSADYYQNAFAVKGGGGQIHGTADQFNFAYQPWTNGLQLTARVQTQPATDPSAKSGVMIRETTNASSKYVDVVVTPGSITMEARTTPGGSAIQLATFTASNSLVGTNSPSWVRLFLQGTTFTGYASSNGVNWVQMGVTNISMTGTLAGLAVCAYDNAQLNTSTFDNVNYQATNNQPVITSQPTNQSVLLGNTVAWAVAASGVAPFNYQWWFNTNTILAGATNASLTLTNVQGANGGNYMVVVTNGYGSATSAVVSLTIHSPPVITNSPDSQSISRGSNAIFTVGASGDIPLSYQWWFNTNTLLAGATNATLTMSNVQSANAGTYGVVVTNGYGTATSAAATLTVVVPFVVASYTNSGSWIWTCPTNVISVQAECWGGGGAGGSGWKQSGNAWGGGGAGGAYAKNARIGVTAGTPYVISVGAGGVSVTNANAAVSGGSSAFSYGATTNCLAVGGAGGVSIVNNTGSGVGGAAGSGTTNGCIGPGSALYAGGSGAAGATSYGGGGGGGAGDNGSGASATNSFGGSGGSGLIYTGGAGGTGPSANNGPGTNGVAPGGGGSGARASSASSINSGGTGGSGQVILTYYFAPSVTSSAASGIGAATATLNGYAQDNGNLISNRGFFYRTTSGVTTNDTIIPAGSGSGAFTAAPVLSPATRYYWKAYAINAGGMVLSPELDFVTASAAPPAFTSASLSADRSIFTVAGTGTANQLYVLQTASSLTPPAAWMPVATNAAATNGVFSFTDAQAGNYTQRFYRVMQP
jgi:poly(beta-D-mannuronate) lyase